MDRCFDPAMVVMRELNEQQQPTTYWIVHKTQLIRCAPHHIRRHLSSVTGNFKEVKKGGDDITSLPRQCRGVTIFQINAETRNELGMITSSSNRSLPPQTARKVAQHEKVQMKRQVKKQKGQGSLSEKNMTLEDRRAFHEAKCKELRAFFENGVCEFSTTSEAGPDKTLTSRILLKWTKNSDGTPRAKARLVARSYANADALAG